MQQLETVNTEEGLNINPQDFDADLVVESTNSEKPSMEELIKSGVIKSFNDPRAGGPNGRALYDKLKKEGHQHYLVIPSQKFKDSGEIHAITKKGGEYEVKIFYFGTKITKETKPKYLLQQ